VKSSCPIEKMTLLQSRRALKKLKININGINGKANLKKEIIKLL